MGIHPGDVLFIPPWWWHEVRTISPGISLSTTFRFHIPDADVFSRVVNDLYQLHQNARKSGSDRLAQHLRSYFAYGLSVEDDPGLTMPSRELRSDVALLVLGLGV